MLYMACTADCKACSVALTSALRPASQPAACNVFLWILCTRITFSPKRWTDRSRLYQLRLLSKPNMKARAEIYQIQTTLQISELSKKKHLFLLFRFKNTFVAGKMHVHY
jgi:hypothetical protein